MACYPRHLVQASWPAFRRSDASETAQLRAEGERRVYIQGRRNDAISIVPTH